MRIVGRWVTGEDGVSRPVVTVKLPAADGAITRDFLVDTGADKTVLTRDTFDSLKLPLPPEMPRRQLAGVGGSIESVELHIRIELTAEDGSPAGIAGAFSAFLDPTDLDIDVLGRDVLNNFDVIVSYPRREVLLLAAPHRYTVGT